MGLDVYLKRYDDFADTRAREARYEAGSEAIWAEVGGGLKYEQLTDAQKAEARSRTEVLATELGLDKYGCDETRAETVERPSALHPDHMFKVGYFRSSYNEGGINRVVKASTGKDLYWVFEPPKDEYAFRPDWSRARERALRLLDEYQSALRADAGSLRVFFEAPNSFRSDAELRANCETTERALEIFRQTKAKPNLGSFSNGQGTFFLEKPLQVVALIEGIGPISERGLYVVHQTDGEDSTWYFQALEIVVETCDYVLAQPNVDQFYLGWSA